MDVGIVDVFAKNSEGKRVHKQLEVDFVVNQGSQRYYIQVAYDMTSEEKQAQELKGFVIMGMKYFFLNANSLEF